MYIFSIIFLATLCLIVLKLRKKFLKKQELLRRMNLLGKIAIVIAIKTTGQCKIPFETLLIESLSNSGIRCVTGDKKQILTLFNHSPNLEIREILNFPDLILTGIAKQIKSETVSHTNSHVWRKSFIDWLQIYYGNYCYNQRRWKI